MKTYLYDHAPCRIPLAWHVLMYYQQKTLKRETRTAKKLLNIPEEHTKNIQETTRNMPNFSNNWKISKFLVFLDMVFGLFLTEGPSLKAPVKNTRISNKNTVKNNDLSRIFTCLTASPEPFLVIQGWLSSCWSLVEPRIFSYLFRKILVERDRSCWAWKVLLSLRDVLTLSRLLATLSCSMFTQLCSILR